MKYLRVLLIAVGLWVGLYLAGCWSCDCMDTETVGADTISEGGSHRRMHPSWDRNNDGINDCEDDGSCDDSIDYTQPRAD